MPRDRPPSQRALATLHWLQDEATYTRTYPATGSEAVRLIAYFLKRRIHWPARWPVPLLEGGAAGGLPGVVGGGGGGGGGGGDLDMWIAVVVPWWKQTIVNGAWQWFGDGSAYGQGFWWNNSTAQNNEITYPVFLTAGTWTLTTTYITNTEQGIATISLDGTTVDTIDGYSAALTYNVKKVTAGLVVATTGVKTLGVKIASKNAASSSYAFRHNVFYWQRTA